jgi:hypothetical protein
MDDIHWTARIQSGTSNGDSEVEHTMLELLGQQWFCIFKQNLGMLHLITDVFVC